MNPVSHNGLDNERINPYLSRIADQCTVGGNIAVNWGIINYSQKITKGSPNLSTPRSLQARINELNAAITASSNAGGAVQADIERYIAELEGYFNDLTTISSSIGSVSSMPMSASSPLAASAPLTESTPLTASTPTDSILNLPLINTIKK